jgi:hypothetical protein
MKKVLVLAAVGEAATGAALLIVPSLVGQLLFGAELTGVAIPVARVSGIALIALGVGCWPGSPPIGILTYSAAITLYLAYVGFAGRFDRHFAVARGSPACDPDGIFVLGIVRSDPFSQGATLVTESCRRRFHSRGVSSSTSRAGWVETRSMTSRRYKNGLMWRCLQVWTSEHRVAVPCPAASLLANR